MNKKLKIGVAIPAYKKDVFLINRCLRSIERQTRKPDFVSISASECTDIKLGNYSFPIEIKTSEKVQNAATNRNIAATFLKDVDIISFIDCDDEMYPQRLEYIEKSFLENKVDFILHNYTIYKNYNKTLLHEEIDNKYSYYNDSIVANPNHCGVMVNKKYIYNNEHIIHHGHISIKRTLFMDEKFQEGCEYLRWEDSEYCRRLVEKKYIGGYLNAKLTKYHDYIETPNDFQTINKIEEIYTKKICVTLYTDLKYLERAKTTINDIRTKGKYEGEIVLMTDGLFKIDDVYISNMKLTIKEYPDIDVSSLIQKIKKHPFINSDKREYEKTKQWNKLYAFDIYFKKYDYVLFVDSGLRIFDNIENFYSSFQKDSLVALNDGHPDFTKKFICQIETTNIEVVEKLKKIYDLESEYFLNCLFLYDTNIIKNDTLTELIKLMNEYPICRTNEMGIMNIYFHRVWKPLNIFLPEKILFDWSERENKTWSDYISLKYPQTIR